MALPTIAVISAAVDSLFAALNDRPTKPRARKGVSDLQRLRVAVEEAYASDFSVTITDNSEAIAAAFLADGEVGLANNGNACVGGEIFTVLGTGDFTADDLAGTAGTPAAAERYQVLSASTVAYLGTATEPSFSAEELEDFYAL